MKNNRQQSAKPRKFATLDNGLTSVTTYHENGSTKIIYDKEELGENGKLSSENTTVTVIKTGKDGLATKRCFIGLYVDNLLELGKIETNGIITHEVIGGKSVPIRKAISEADKIIFDDEEAKTSEEDINERVIVQKVRQSIAEKQPSNRVQSASVYKASTENSQSQNSQS